MCFTMLGCIGSQTLGEEYCDILQFNNNTALYPRFFVSTKSSIYQLVIKVIDHHLIVSIEHCWFYCTSACLTCIHNTCQSFAMSLRNTIRIRVIDRIIKLDRDSMSLTFSLLRGGFFFLYSHYLPADMVVSKERFQKLVHKVFAPAMLKRIRESFSSVHLMIFYFYGTYYHLSKRLTGIRHVSLYQPSL